MSVKGNMILKKTASPKGKKNNPDRNGGRPVRGNTGKSQAAAHRRQEEAYGEKRSICMNAGCAMRKKAKCFGFEGCPGFKGD